MEPNQLRSSYLCLLTSLAFILETLLCKPTHLRCCCKSFELLPSMSSFIIQYDKILIFHSVYWKFEFGGKKEPYVHPRTRIPKILKLNILSTYCTVRLYVYSTAVLCNDSLVHVACQIQIYTSTLSTPVYGTRGRWVRVRRRKSGKEIRLFHCAWLILVIERVSAANLIMADVGVAEEK